MKAWANLGMYFSYKLKAAVAYQSFVMNGEHKSIQNAVALLEKAATYWDELVNVTQPMYQPIPMMGVDYNSDLKLFHWSNYQSLVYDELDWLKSLAK